MPVCPYCNGAMPVNSEFCPFCGRRAIPGSYQDSPPVIENVTMLTALQKYAQFSGRARRSEYWLFVLFCMIVNVAASIIDIVLGMELLQTVSTLAFMIPGWAVFCRRMHDTGRSGWNWLWALLPFVGWIVLLIFACQDSQPGANKYGFNPKGR